MDTTRYDAQEAADLDHNWDGTRHLARRRLGPLGARSRARRPWGTFTGGDIPWQYGLADAFTICDRYFCSIQGPTTPNRLFLWTGTIDPAGTAGGWYDVTVTVTTDDGTHFAHRFAGSLEP
jgi:phospholipase C